MPWLHQERRGVINIYSGVPILRDIILKGGLSGFAVVENPDFFMCDFEPKVCPELHSNGPNH